jgi:hypothetical protein
MLIELPDRLGLVGDERRLAAEEELVWKQTASSTSLDS